MQHTDFYGDVNRLSPPRKAPRISPSQRTPFLMLFGDDFLSGCRKSAMTPEQVGMYIVMLILEWTDKGPLEDDMKRLSVRSGWDVRLVRRLINELVSLKKYDREDGRLSNGRMQHEIAIYVQKAKAKEDRRANTSRADVAQKSEISATAVQDLSNSYPTANGHLSKKSNENNVGASKKASYARARQNQKQKPEAEAATSVAAKTAPLRPDLDKLSDRLLSACNGALDNPVNCLGLLNLSIPQMWLKSGCDLELDVLPTLKAAGKKYHGKRIRDWSYFTGMIAEAKARREAGLPEIAISKREKEPELHKLKRMVNAAYDHQQGRQPKRIAR